MFNEHSLREKIAEVWGEYGAHTDVYDALLERSELLNELFNACTMKNAELPDMLDAIEAALVKCESHWTFRNRKDRR